MAAIRWTYESPYGEDDPREGETVWIWVDRDRDGDLVFDGVTEAGSYRSIPELIEWATQQFDDLTFCDLAYEALDDEGVLGRAA